MTPACSESPWPLGLHTQARALFSLTTVRQSRHILCYGVTGPIIHVMLLSVICATIQVCWKLKCLLLQFITIKYKQLMRSKLNKGWSLVWNAGPTKLKVRSEEMHYNSQLMKLSNRCGVLNSIYLQTIWNVHKQFCRLLCSRQLKPSLSLWWPLHDFTGGVDKPETGHTMCLTLYCPLQAPSS